MPPLRALDGLGSAAEAALPRDADHTAVHGFLRGYVTRPDS